LSFHDFCKKKFLDRGTFNYWLLTFAPEGHLSSKEMGKEKERSESEEIRELKRPTPPERAGIEKREDACRFL